MWRYVAAFAVGAVSEYYAEVWGVRYANAINGRYSRLKPEEIAAKIATARKWGSLLLLLGAVDVASVFGGWGLYVAVIAGALVGAWTGLGHVMRAKWERNNPEED